jgi:hypothetical protein
MKKYLFNFLLTILASAVSYAQETLPSITVKNINERIIVSWRNEYKIPVATINIQRSFDSLKNYKTIGSVLNPMNVENGYADANPPYNKMYYRVFIGFEGGTYLISSAFRPVKEDQNGGYVPIVRYSWQLGSDTAKEFTLPAPGSISPVTGVRPSVQSPPAVVPAPAKEAAIPYPSQRIFTARDNNVVIYLPDAKSKKYNAIFFDDANNQLFELTKLEDEYLIIEKVNFVHAGWFYFELYENQKLLEKNKFYVAKDEKKPDSNKRQGNK